MSMNASVEIGKSAGIEISRHLYGHFIEHLGRVIYDGIFVGEDSRIPNVRGIRSDIVEAYRAIRVPVIRWPGGNFADDYHWMDGIGDRRKRTRQVNTTGYKIVEDNSFGTHEFMDFCEQTGAEPYICGNVGSGTVREMSEWIEYLTHPDESPMADLRRRNGREQPWRIRFWGIGNEAWAHGGNMTVEHYDGEARRFATYCNNYGDNQLYKIMCGPHRFDYHWTEHMMGKSFPYQPDGHWGKNLMHGLSLHCYVFDGEYFSHASATGFDERGWFNIQKGSMEYDELLTRHSAIMAQHDPANQVALIFDEWGAWYAAEPGTNPKLLFQQNTQRDAVFAATNFNVMQKHARRLYMANIAQSVNALQALVLTDGPRMLLTPTYHVFDMYQGHQDAQLLDTKIEGTAYEYRGESMPAVSASASEKDGARLITLSNVHYSQAADVSISVDCQPSQKVSGRILHTSKPNTINTFDDPETVKPASFDGFARRGGGISLTMPPRSVIALVIEAR